MPRFLFSLISLTFCAVLATPSVVLASDDFFDKPAASAKVPEVPAWLTDVRKSIKDKKYDDAYQKLVDANQTGSADWNNLMGFTARKKSSPELDRSEYFYKEALKIDPNHLGTLEYYGELFLMKEDMKGAVTMLERLQKACPKGCEQIQELKTSIANYRKQASSY